jgi:hypothetical protein
LISSVTWGNDRQNARSCVRSIPENTGADLAFKTENV